MAHTTANFAGLAALDIEARASAVSRPSLFTRIAHAVHESRRRRTESEIARYIRRNGGVMTDNMEREISRKFGGIVA